MRERTARDIENNLKSLLRTVDKTLKAENIEDDKKEKLLDGLEQITTHTLAVIQYKYPDYNLGKKYKKFYGKIEAMRGKKD